MKTSLAALTAAAVVLAGCNPLDPSGTLQARWVTAGDTAEVTMPVTATWCVGAGRLDIRAAAGDTGLGLTLFATDSAALAGRYPVIEPGSRVTVRPSAVVALRWMSKVVLQGWWGDSGLAAVAGGRVRGLSGSGEAWLTSGLGPDSVTALTFGFRGVRVRNDTLCDAPPVPLPPKEAPPDSGEAVPVAGVH